MPRLSTHREDRLRREYQRKRRETAPRDERTFGNPYEQLRAGIRTGEVPQNEQLNEQQLMVSLMAPRNSVRRALQMLAADGLVDRERRAGTNVSGSIVVFGAARVLPTEGVEDLIGVPADPSRLVVTEVDFEIMPTPPMLAERLATAAAEVIGVRQLAHLDGRPLYLRSGYAVSFKGYREQLEEADRRLRTLEDAFASLFGVPFGGCEITIHAAEADDFTAQVLEVEAGSPVLVREMMVHDVENTPRELSYTYFRGDRSSLVSSEDV